MLISPYSSHQTYKLKRVKGWMNLQNLYCLSSHCRFCKELYEVKEVNEKFDFKVFIKAVLNELKGDSYVPLCFMAWPKTSLITDGTQQTKYNFMIDDSDLKNDGGKPTVRVASLGHTSHVWLNGEYLGNGHGNHDEKSRWSLSSGACFYCFRCAKPRRCISMAGSPSSLHYYKLPLKEDKTGCYEYVDLYSVLSMNSSFWSAVFHTR
ncbi:Uncharacterized protein Rs2_38601 [Raphanus sativus]|nr:Uncharacterized protein Rs2_38601 [Raphanus sativus]